MKAISLWQPWASLWISSRKVHETRHWHVRRQWKDWKSGDLLAVHAAQKFVRNVEPELRAILDDEFGGHWGMDLPTGAIIGAVELIDCQSFSSDIRHLFESGQLLRGSYERDDIYCGDFSPGRYGWRRGRYWALATPQPWKGLQGIFEIPDRLVLGNQRAEHAS